MDSKKETKLNMYNAVISHCNANAAIVATVPAFQDALENLSGIYSDIISTAQLEMQVISGIAMDKSVSRKNLTEQAAIMAAAVYAFAASDNDNEMKEQVNYSISKLNSLKDELLIPVCQNIRTIANDNIASLAGYGITAATITSFDNLIEGYGIAIPQPRNATTQRSAYATALKALFKEADEILKEQMDKMAPQFKANNPDFYNTYKNNRIILDAPTSVTKVAGIITDNNNAQPISGISVEVIGQSYNAASNGSGEYDLNIPVPGSYSIKFSHPNYTEKTISNVTVSLGHTTSLDTSMVAA